MTYREFLTQSIEIFEQLGKDEMAERAKIELEKLNKANETRRNKPSKAAEANAPLAVAIVETILADNSTKTTTEIAALLRELFPAEEGEKEISTQRATPILRQLVADGTLKVADVKVPKKGTQKAYALIDAPVAEDAE